MESFNPKDYQCHAAMKEAIEEEYAKQFGIYQRAKERKATEKKQNQAAQEAKDGQIAEQLEPSIANRREPR